MADDTKRALYRLGRELLYRKLPIVGHCLWIQSEADLEPALRRLVAPWIPADAPWDGADLAGALAKLGLVDRWFTAASALLDDASTLVGVPALRENGFGKPRERDEDPEVEAEVAAADAGFLLDLAAGLDAGTCVLKVFLEDDVPRDERWSFITKNWNGTGPIPMMPKYFPRELTVTDACVTNLSMIWFGKHFYM